MKIYEVNVWEGRGDHKTWLFTNKKKALEDANEFRKNAWVSEVWLRVWVREGGEMKIEENGPVFQR